jgi:hypothetical protein
MEPFKGIMFTEVRITTGQKWPGQMQIQEEGQKVKKDGVVSRLELEDSRE